MTSLLPVLTLALLISFTSAIAQISPGKLSRFHSAIEGISNCTKCHELGKSVLASKCLECHTALKARIDAGKGYHAHAEVTGTTCIKCHSDHHGENYELIHWHEGEKNFDHAKTGYQLDGEHNKLDCRACHKSPLNEKAIKADNHINWVRTYLGLGTSCTSCHQDEHRGSLDQNCLKCHNMEKWKPATGFKHDKAKYSLTGRHQKVECTKCHKIEPGEPAHPGYITKKDGSATFARYKPLSYSSCTACHEDIHKNKFGTNCESCHSTGGWTELKSGTFDHSKTPFPLTGKHLAVSCAKCHTGGKKTEKLKFALCMDCHKDHHNGQFAARKESGPECQFCHTVNGWLPSTYGFDQHQTSRYPLTGSHLATPCALCHKPEEREGAKIARFQYPDFACKTCHDDVHKKEADKWMTAKGCDACHTTDAWNEVTFDHSKSKFPLDGRHKTADCDACHKVAPNNAGEKILKLTGLPINCSGCHKDVHQGQFTVEGVIDECSRCHTPASWRWLRFNHNEARYKLDGAHAKVACNKCHHEEIGSNSIRFIRYRPVPMACSDCHTGSIENKNMQEPNNNRGK